MKKLLYEIFSIAFGVLLAGVALKSFLLPNGFLDGGVTGIAILLSEVFNHDVSVILVAVSVPFLAMAWFTLSKRIFIKSVLSIVALAVLIHFASFDIVTEDKLLVCIFGGLLLGIGIGITINSGAVLDGSEILGIFMNDRFGISIGKVILVFNIILFSVTAAVLSTEAAMYSVLTFLICAQVIDKVVAGFEDFVGLVIVSDKAKAVKKGLIEKIGAGVTVYSGAGGYGKRGEIHNKEILHTVINRIDIHRTYKMIDLEDPQAFITEFDVNGVKGGVFHRYLNRAGLKKLSAG